MAFPAALLGLVKPVLGLVISKDPTGEDSTLAKNWRPWTMGTFLVLFVVSVFTGYDLSDAQLTMIGAVMLVMVGGRSYEKKAISKAIDALKKMEKEKREE